MELFSIDFIKIFIFGSENMKNKSNTPEGVRLSSISKQIEFKDSDVLMFSDQKFTTLRSQNNTKINQDMMTKTQTQSIAKSIPLNTNQEIDSKGN